MSSKCVIEDEITEKIGVLTRRETEARIIIPFFNALCSEFGRDSVVSILKSTILEISKNQGDQLAKRYGTGVEAFFETLKFWMKDGALEIDILDKNEETLDFNVTRCKYAEMYHSLGITELGKVLSCNRDAALIEGFNASASLKRKKTIMNGDKCCNFRYTFPKK